MRDHAVLVRDRDRTDADERGGQHAVPCAAGAWAPPTRPACSASCASVVSIELTLRSRWSARMSARFRRGSGPRAAPPGAATGARRRAAASGPRNTPANRSCAPKARNRSGPNHGRIGLDLANSHARLMATCPIGSAGSTGMSDYLRLSIEATSVVAEIKGDQISPSGSLLIRRLGAGGTETTASPSSTTLPSTLASQESRTMRPSA